jgi:CrcB protein
MRYLAIAVGAALGANARYLLGIYVAERIGGGFPYGTLIINVTGSIAIGFFLTLVTQGVDIDPVLRLFVVTGFLGGYTTFSTYSFEGLTLLLHGDAVPGLAYLVGSVGGGLLGAFAGALGAEWLLDRWPGA